MPSMSGSSSTNRTPRALPTTPRAPPTKCSTPTAPRSWTPTAASRQPFDNLLVLFSASALRDDEQTFDYDLSMGGGVWLNGGHLWYITWTQGTDTTFQFYDADGELLTLNAGRSYLALVSSVTGQELAVTNSAGENLIQ